MLVDWIKFCSKIVISLNMNMIHQYIEMWFGYAKLEIVIFEIVCGLRVMRI